MSLKLTPETVPAFTAKALVGFLDKSAPRVAQNTKLIQYAADYLQLRFAALVDPADKAFLEQQATALLQEHVGRHGGELLAAELDQLVEAALTPAPPQERPAPFSANTARGNPAARA